MAMFTANATVEGEKVSASADVEIGESLEDATELADSDERDGRGEGGELRGGVVRVGQPARLDADVVTVGGRVEGEPAAVSVPEVDDVQGLGLRDEAVLVQQGVPGDASREVQAAV